MINARLNNLPNFAAQYIQFSIRRNVLTCLENSPTAARLEKPQTLGINYISITGWDLPKFSSNVSEYILREQKKTALEVMSTICSGEFSSALEVIANQPETIEKIKSQFELLASLVGEKSAMIAPTFISIATHNAEMGDWIINKFISKEQFEPTDATLTGKIVICDKSRVTFRLRMLLARILEIFEKAKQKKLAAAQG